MTKKTTMTRGLENIQADLTAKVLEYNSLMKDANFTEAEKASNAVSEFVKEYAAVAQKNQFEVFHASNNPMLEAVKQLTYPVLTVKNSVDEKTSVPIKVIDTKDAYIDLLKLQKYIGENIGKEENWEYMIENFNFRMTLGVAKDLGIDTKKINDSYAMNKLAKEMEDGKAVVSNTKKLAVLQEIITAMLGDGYKVNSHDVAYLNNIYCKKGKKALTVVCSNHRYMRQYIAEIAHRVVCGEKYGVEYKAKK